MIQAFIDVRLGAIESIEPKSSIDDVIFTIQVENYRVSKSGFYLLNRSLTSFANKAKEVENTILSIQDGSFFIENAINVYDLNLVLFFSFDSLNLVDNCYIFDFDKSLTTLLILNKEGDIIISKKLPSWQSKQHNEPIISQSAIGVPLETYLFFDTETTGLPKNWKAPITDLNNWPRLVQLAFSLHDSKGNEITSADIIIKPEGFLIPPAASNIHKVTHQRALSEGKCIDDVLVEFDKLVLKADYLVAHNMSFDEKIIGAEYLRKGKINSIANKSRICTMESSTKYCAILDPYGRPKWPKLSELHLKLFKTNFEDAHNAAVDNIATAKCFWELKRLGIL